METTPFFLVWNPEGRSPTVRHLSYSAAKTEAIRLASSMPGSRFFVLQVIGVAKVVEPVTWTPIHGGVITPVGTWRDSLR